MRGASEFAHSDKFILVLVFLFLFICEATAQAKFDKIKITLTVTNRSLADVLDEITRQSAVAFSYNPRRIPVAQKITYRCIEKPLTDVVREIVALTGTSYELVEDQVILRPGKTDESAKEITISGFVKDKSNGEALIGATISVPGSAFGVVTNGFGFYSLTVPKGKYSLACSFLGYKRYAADLDLSQATTLDVVLQEEPPLLKEIVVNETADNSSEDTQAAKLNVKAKTVEQRPALFGETDVVKSLESIPGVKLNSDGSTFYYVRGGNRDQNLVLIDDAPIYNPSHMLGLFSTIIPDVINDITFYKGDSPASLGGRISSVMEIRTKKGNDQHLQAWGSTGLIASKLGVEGPIKKDKSSFLVSARASTLKWFFHAVDNDISKFNFYDVTAKANFRLNSVNRIFFSLYTGQDNYFVNNAGISWKNTAGTVRWNHTIGERLFMNTTFAGSSYDYSLYTDAAAGTRWTSHISNANIKSDFSYFVRPDNEIDFGLGVNGYNFNPGNFEDKNGVSPFPVVSVRNSTEVIVYANHSVKLGEHWGFNYGVRLSDWTDTGPAFEIVYDQNRNPVDTLNYPKGRNYKNYVNAEPRATISYRLGEGASFKASFSRNAQNIHLISNSVSPFTSLEVWLPSSINIRPQVANQATAGYYKSLGNSGIVMEAELFYKQLLHQIDYVPHAATFLNPLIESQLVFGTGKSYGLEFLAKRDQGRLRGMAGYSYSRAKRKFADLNQGQTFNAFADRPHQITFMMAYDISLRWNLGVNWNYSTGSPYSSPTGFYKYNDQEVPVYGQKNNDRLPAYHRMDISATFKLNKNPEKKFTHSLTLSVFNLYGRRNPLFVNYNKVQDASGDIKIPTNLQDANRITSNYYLFQFTPSLSYNFKWL